MATAVAEPKLVKLTEITDIAGKVDRENNVIRGVKLTGLVSKNGRRYTEAAARGAAKLYEGSSIYLNHAKEKGNVPRRYEDRISTIGEGVTFKKDGLYGDLNYNPKHPNIEQFLYDAEHQTKGIGLSHNVEARVNKVKGEMVVEEIARVHSVDVVCDPATTKSLWESEGDSEPTVTLKEFVETTADLDPEIKTLLETMMAMPGPTGPATASAPMAQPGQAAPDSPVKGAMLAAIMAHLSAADPDTIKKVLKDIGMSTDVQDHVAGDGTKPVKEPAAADAGMKEAIEQLTKRQLATEVLQECAVPVKVALVDELVTKADAKEMKTLVESWSPEKKGKTRPRLSLTESTNGATKRPLPTNPEEFARRLKHRF